MKKKNILSLTVLSSLMAIAGFSSFNRVSADSVGVHAAETTSTNMPTGWEASGVTADNTISPFKDPVQGNSILLKRTVAEGALMARSTLTTVKPNTYYNFSVNAKTTGASQLKIRVVEYKDGASASKATEVIKVTTVTGDWISRPGMLKTTAETKGVVIEIEATGTGEVYASKLFVHEGVAATGVMTGRTKYFEGDPTNPETGMGSTKNITNDVLSKDSATGQSAMKLTPGRGVYLKFDDYKITGKFTLRFKYKYVGAGGVKLTVKLDNIDSAGKRQWYGESPRVGFTPHYIWDNYSYNFSAKAGECEPIFVIIYAGLNGVASSEGYYLIDDVEVIDEHGNNLIENGDFELKESTMVNTMGYVDIKDSGEGRWDVSKFAAIPSSAYINDGVGGTRAIHLDSEKALGISIPLLAQKQYTLTFNYRSNVAPNLAVRTDGFLLSGNQFWTAPIALTNTNNEWASTSFTFKTFSDKSHTDTQYIVFNAHTPIDLDNVSLKDSDGNEFLYGGNFDPLMGGGLTYVNNAAAYLDEQGDVVYSSLKSLSKAYEATGDSYIYVNPYSLGLETAKLGTAYNVSFEYLGGTNGGCGAVSDRNDWISGQQNSTFEWKKVTTSKPFTITEKEGYNAQELRIYGTCWWGTPITQNCYIRNISVKDADGNEYFHPLSNGASILPQGSFLINDKEAVDEFVAAYITGEAAEDYTAIPEADRASKCQNKLAKAEGALKRMTASQQELFRTSDDYAAARAAMDMWRSVSSKTSIGIFGGNTASNSTTILVCTLLAVSAVAVTSFVLIRKKKHN